MLRAVPAFVILPKVTTLPQLKYGEMGENKKASQGILYHLLICP